MGVVCAVWHTVSEESSCGGGLHTNHTWNMFQTAEVKLSLQCLLTIIILMGNFQQSSVGVNGEARKLCVPVITPAVWANKPKLYLPQHQYTAREKL